MTYSPARNPFRTAAIAAVRGMTDGQLAAFAMLEWHEPHPLACGALQALLHADEWAASLDERGTAASKAATLGLLMRHATAWKGKAATAIKSELQRRLDRYRLEAPLSTEAAREG